MIRIQYKSLPPGMHAEAEARTRGIVVHLLPGLTPAQRKAALRRLRQEGSRGCGPRLPDGQLAVACAADRLGVAVRSTARAVRQHPLGLLIPALLAGGLLAAFVLASAGMPVPASLLPGASGAASWSMPHQSPGPQGPGRGGATGPAGPGTAQQHSPGSVATAKALPPVRRRRTG